MKTANPALPPHFLPSLAASRGHNFLWKTHTLMIGKSFVICTLHFKHDSESTQDSKFSHHVCTGNTRVHCPEKPMLFLGSGNHTTSEKNLSLFNHEGEKRKSPQYPLKVLKESSS